jgi:hypothetical protein
MSSDLPPTPDAGIPMTADLGETAPGIAVFPRRPEDRLRLALHRLNAAIAEQCDATAGLRAAIGDLSSTMARLGESVTGYRGALDSTATEIERALCSARKLQDTADRMAV